MLENHSSVITSLMAEEMSEGAGQLARVEVGAKLVAFSTCENGDALEVVKERMSLNKRDDDFSEYNKTSHKCSGLE